MNNIHFSMLMHFEIDPEEVRLLMKLPWDARRIAVMELLKREGPTNERLEDFELSNLEQAYGLNYWKQLRQERDAQAEIKRMNSIPTEVAIY